MGGSENGRILSMESAQRHLKLPIKSIYEQKVVPFLMFERDRMRSDAVFEHFYEITQGYPSQSESKGRDLKVKEKDISSILVPYLYVHYLFLDYGLLLDSISLLYLPIDDNGRFRHKIL